VQRDANARLELLNGLAERGRRDAEVSGCSRKASPSRDRDEGVEGVERSKGHREGLPQPAMSCRLVGVAPHQPT
jgi:hypothetical protein